MTHWMEGDWPDAKKDSFKILAMKRLVKVAKEVIGLCAIADDYDDDLRKAHLQALDLLGLVKERSAISQEPTMTLILHSRTCSLNTFARFICKYGIKLANAFLIESLDKQNRILKETRAGE